jgi:MATE family multidrug resistance protein
MLGRLGPEALAAGGLAANLLFTPELIGIGVLSASGAFAAHAHGAGDREAVADAIRQGLRMALLLAVPGVAMVLALPWLLGRLGEDPGLVAGIAGYLHAGVFGLPLGLLFAALRNFLHALGRPRVITLIMLGAVGLRVPLNQLFIHGGFGLAGMGVTGAGVASSLTYAGMLAALVLYVGLYPLYRPYGVLRHLGRPGWKLFFEILHNGWPTGVVLAAEAGLFLVTGLLMGLLGPAALAAHQIVITTCAITFMVPLALAQAATVRVGHAIGAGRPDRVRRVGFTAIGLGMAWMTVSAASFILLPRTIIGLYIDPADPANQAAVAVALMLLPIGALFQVFDGTQVVASGALRGLKDTRWPMAIALFGYWALGLAGGCLLGFGLGLGGPGLWWGLALGLAAVALLLGWRFHRRSGAVRRHGGPAVTPAR